MKVLKFEATWCNQCKALDKELSKIKDFDIEHIDVDEDSSEALVGKYKIMSLPTILILQGDEVVFRNSGLIKATKLEDKYKELKEKWDLTMG